MSVIFRKLDKQTYTTEFESHWMDAPFIRKLLLNFKVPLMKPVTIGITIKIAALIKKLHISFTRLLRKKMLETISYTNNKNSEKIKNIKIKENKN